MTAGLAVDWGAVAAVFAVFVVGLVSPGPNFVAVAHRAVAASRAQAVALGFGVATVSALWAAAAVFGVGALFRLFPWTFWALKLGGAAYLVWFGARLIRRAKLPLPAGQAQAAAGGLWRAYRSGVLTNLANPKAVAFYASVFSTAAPRHGGMATLLAIVVVVAISAAAWYAAVAVALSTGALSRSYRAAKAWIERVCGTAIMLFGVKLAISR